jgi:hypothetical protein
MGNIHSTIVQWLSQEALILDSKSLVDRITYLGNGLVFHKVCPKRHIQLKHGVFHSLWVLKGYVKILKKAIGKTDGQIRKMNRNKNNENIKQTYMFEQ